MKDLKKIHEWSSYLIECENSIKFNTAEIELETNHLEFIKSKINHLKLLNKHLQIEKSEAKKIIKIEQSKTK